MWKTASQSLVRSYRSVLEFKVCLVESSRMELELFTLSSTNPNMDYLGIEVRAKKPTKFAAPKPASKLKPAPDPKPKSPEKSNSSCRYLVISPPCLGPLWAGLAESGTVQGSLSLSLGTMSRFRLNASILSGRSSVHCGKQPKR